MNLNRLLVTVTINEAAIKAHLAADNFDEVTQQQIVAFLQEKFGKAVVQSKRNVTGYFEGGIKASGLKNKARSGLASLCDVEMYWSNARWFNISVLRREFYTATEQPFVQ
jgi:hypothetical protein